MPPTHPEPSDRLAVAWLLPPAAIIGWFCASAGTLPDDDYWQVLRQITDRTGALWPDGSSLLPRSNEHLVPGFGALVGLNVLATGGDNRGLTALAWLATAAQVGLLWPLVPKTSGGRRMAALLLAGFLFTPAAWFDWMRGQAGVQWCVSQALAVAALVAAERWLRTRGAAWLTLAVAAAWASCLLFSAGFAVVPALAALLLLGRPGRAGWAVWAVLALTLLAWAGHGYAAQNHHPSALSASPLQLLAFAPVFLGGIVAGGAGRAELAFALIAGLLALLAAAGIGRDVRERDRIWWSLLAFAVANALLCAVFRCGFGVGMAASSRFMPVAGLFWASLAVLVLSTPHRRAGLAVLAGVLLLSWVIHAPNIARERDRQAGKSAVASDLTEGRIDRTSIARHVTSSPEDVAAVLPRLEALRHTPYGAKAP